MFERLPETFPKHNGMKRPALVSSAAFHLILLALLIVLPIALTPDLVSVKPVTHLYLPPPPAALAMESPPEAVPAAQREPVKRAIPAKEFSPKRTLPKTVDSPDSQPELIAPTRIPAEIATFSPPDFVRGVVIGGVPGGVPGGTINGVVDGMVRNTAENSRRISPPLPPPPAASAPTPAPVTSGPVRVGGDVRPPELTKYVPPRYPILAKRTRVQGTVELEATVTKQGAVKDVRVISGNPLLVPAAVEAVRQWHYEPTKLNGTPVAVVLTAKVNFFLENPAS
jgi:protein TonB